MKPELGAWNLQDKKVEIGATLVSWSVLAFVSEDKLPFKVIEAFVRDLIVTCQDTGMVS